MGQFDPGRAGGFNQGAEIETKKVPNNPWDFVLTLEGTVAWASGLYRRQGVSYRSFLCSPFTVRSNPVGYGSASSGDRPGAEVWMPVWKRPASYSEVKVLLREGRASIEQLPAQTGIEFAEAACSLGVDRGITSFVRYNLLKRRGDSYIALPAGEFPVGYRSESDRVRELTPILDALDRAKLPATASGLRRNLDSAIYDVLLQGGSDRLLAVVAALGRLLRWVAVTGKSTYLPAGPNPGVWIEACGFTTEIRIAAALASIYDPAAGPMRENLFAGSDQFAWTGRNLAERMLAVVDRRMRTASAAESKRNPFYGGLETAPGDATLFIEGSVDDRLIEDLLFAFTCMDWKGYRGRLREQGAETLAVYAVIKHLFLPGEVEVAGEKKRLAADTRIVSLLRAGQVADAAEIAVRRLRIAGLRPLQVSYSGGDALRLGASLLIPVSTGKALSAAILHDREEREAHA